MSKHKLIKINQLFKFLMIGGFSVVVDCLIFVFLLHTVNTSLLVANSFAFITSLGLNFFGHSFYTYQKKPGLNNVIKYLIIAIVNYCLSLGIIFFGIHFFPSPEFWKLISIGFISINSYLIGRYWIFRHV